MTIWHKESKNYPLSDESIIELYWLRDEKAIEESDVKYGKYLISIAYNIVRDKLDCEECLNDTYIGAWNSIPPSRPDSLKAFLAAIIRRIAINRYHAKQKKSTVPSEMTVALSELENFLSDDKIAEAEFDARRLGEIISGYVMSLPERKRLIFMYRYYVADPIDRIARRLGLSRSTVNKELAAIRMGLKEKLESEGYTI